ncbi:MAG TPA: hypothetical protein DHW82_01255 [Spirochaetia bacterium]|nr:MAG: hypothetical protein A2Y41_04715 [Spirochaetes bacterium GWB1_36_13]HCL55624.1 hypothetical protein [Spirochaetia bacterium]
MTKISINTLKNENIIDITDKVNEEIAKNKMTEGEIFLYLPHTTCALVVTEKTDSAYKYDFLKASKEMVKNYAFKHVGGNGEAHFKAAVFGTSRNLIVSNGKLLLGEWQGIFLVEFDGPRNREIMIKFRA